MNYLLNVTFHAGSDNEEDTDNGLFLLSVKNEISKSQMEKIFIDVNENLNSWDYNYPISYCDDGMNIFTLMEGVAQHLKGKLEVIEEDCGPLNFDNYYKIEQWC